MEWLGDASRIEPCRALVFHAIHSPCPGGSYHHPVSAGMQPSPWSGGTNAGCLPREFPRPVDVAGDTGRDGEIGRGAPRQNQPHPPLLPQFFILDGDRAWHPAPRSPPWEDRVDGGHHAIFFTAPRPETCIPARLPRPRQEPRGACMERPATAGAGTHDAIAGPPRAIAHKPYSR